MIREALEKNRHDILESIFELNSVVKSNGRMCLAPRLHDPDQFLAKVESKKSFEFCINIEELRMATLAIKLDLSSL